MGRPFYDFVAPGDEAVVRSWIDTCKGWGVNLSGQPSDGGFGFGKFRVYVPGRDSRCGPLASSDMASANGNSVR